MVSIKLLSKSADSFVEFKLIEFLRTQAIVWRIGLVVHNINTHVVRV
jgi:hypothetical protein